MGASFKTTGHLDISLYIYDSIGLLIGRPPLKKLDKMRQKAGQFSQMGCIRAQNDSDPPGRRPIGPKRRMRCATLGLKPCIVEPPINSLLTLGVPQISGLARSAGKKGALPG